MDIAATNCVIVCVCVCVYARAQSHLFYFCLDFATLMSIFFFPCVHCAMYMCVCGVYVSLSRCTMCDKTIFEFCGESNNSMFSEKNHAIV